MTVSIVFLEVAPLTCHTVRKDRYDDVHLANTTCRF